MGSKYMDKLPTVISCCFCCFLRAGSVLIGLVSFLAGLALAPNVTYTHGFWDMNGVLNKQSTLTETTMQVSLGLVSIGLCVISVLLIVGALCNMPTLIVIYQWGAVVYGLSVFIINTVLSLNCVFVQGNCWLASGTLLIVSVISSLLTTYFVIVVNSLRMSMLYIASDTLDL